MSERITVRDIARVSGVSLATVSLVVNGKGGVSDDTRRRVLATIEELGYQRRTQRPTLGLLVERLKVPVFGDPFVGAMVQGVELEASAQGYHVLLASIEPGISHLPAMVVEEKVSGLVVLGGGDISDNYIRLLVRTGIPIVLADNEVTGLAVPCVMADNFGGAYLATFHLLEQGHERIALLEGPPEYKTLRERKEGYLRALEQAGFAADPRLMIKPIQAHPRKGYEEALALLSLPATDRPTAIFATSDKRAFGALDALRDSGLRVPDDMALAGFDDISDSAHAAPALTTVRVPTQLMGEVAAKQLVALIEGSDIPPAKTVLYTALQERQSTSVRVAMTA